MSLNFVDRPDLAKPFLKKGLIEGDLRPTDRELCANGTRLGLQPELRGAYATRSPRPLGFGFGYPIDPRKSNLLLGTKVG